VNWPAVVFNPFLAIKGEILLGLDVINNWDTELKEMNKDKEFKRRVYCHCNDSNGIKITNIGLWMDER
jgi:hypothetical protein